MQAQALTPCLWFSGQQAEEAARLYVSLVPGAELGEVGPMATTFFLAGTRVLALNGNPGHPFTEAISLQLSCDDQAELDQLWGAFLAHGGKPGPCGWLTDRFGVSWQIIPKRLPELLQHPGAVQAMLQMSKIEIAALERAARSNA